MAWIRASILFLVTVLGICINLPPVMAKDFYEGKIITIIVPGSPGGGFDTFTRLAGRHLDKFIPGGPKLVVKNMAGGGGRKATNFAFNKAKKDGTFLFLPPSNIVINQLLSPKGVRYDARKFIWIGSHSRNYVWVAHQRSGVKSYKNLTKRSLVTAATRPYSMSHIVPLLAGELLQIKPPKINFGYGGNKSISLAMTRGEVYGGALSWQAFQLQTKSVRMEERPIPILQVGVRPERGLKDVPLLSSLVSRNDRRITRILDSYSMIGYGLVVPPGTPKKAYSVLRKGYDGMNKDKKFLAAMKKLRINLVAEKGSEVQEFVNQVFKGANPETLNRIRRLVAKNPGINKKKKKKKKNGGSGVTLPIPPNQGVRLGPAPTPAPAPAPVLRTPHWNAWVQNGDKLVDGPENIAGRTYTLYLDVSALSYKSLLLTNVSVASTKGHPEFVAQVKSGIRKFKIRPIVLNETVVFTDRATRDLVLSLPALQNKNQASMRAESEQVKRLRNKEISLHKFSKTISAVIGGPVSFSFTSQNAGCAQIVFSIWDESGLVPLDYLVYEFPVRVSGETVPNCNTGTTIANLTGGFQGMLNIDLSRNMGREMQADAGLFIFERSRDAGGPRGSVVMYVDAKNQNEPLAWLTRSNLSNYFEKTLPEEIKMAGRRAKQGSQNPYSAVAVSLKKKIFSGSREGSKQGRKHRQQASKAFEALKMTVDAKKADALIVARMISDKNVKMYVPLNLLTAKQTNPFFKNSLIVVQPLPKRETYAATQTCVKPWTFGIPVRLDGVNTGRLSEVDFPRWKNSSLYRWLSDIGSLEKFFEGVKSYLFTANNGISEGLVLLAHQANTELWYNKTSVSWDKVVAEEMNRSKFPAGSIAVVVACSAIQGSSANTGLVSELNNLGIGAMVVSPFAVDAKYGAEFAVQFATAVKSAHEKGKTPSMMQLFRTATEQTAANLKKHKTNSNLVDMALEFIIVGDPTIRLCKI